MISLCCLMHPAFDMPIQPLLSSSCFCCHADMRPCQVDSGNFHMTIFMTSQPSDPRVDPFVLGGGIDRSQPLTIIPAPDEHTLQKEIDAWRDQAASTPAPDFEASILLCGLDQCSASRHVCRIPWDARVSMHASFMAWACQLAGQLIVFASILPACLSAMLAGMHPTT